MILFILLAMFLNVDCYHTSEILPMTRMTEGMAITVTVDKLG
jgi:hypothetical protein